MTKSNWIVAASFLMIAGYYGNTAFAASGSGKGGSAASAGNAGGATASADVRLRAKFEVDAEADVDTNPEFHADYRMKKGVPQLQVRVENIELGTVVDVFIQNLKIGSATVEADGVGTEAALDFKKGQWPAGLPTELTAGMVVRIFSGTTLLFEAPFEAK